MRLALQVGRLDWRRAVNEIAPWQFAEWLAFERVEPYGQTWHQSSMIASVITNHLIRIAGGLGGQKPEEESLYTPDAFVPGVAVKQEHEKVEKAVKSLDGLIGL